MFRTVLRSLFTLITYLSFILGSVPVMAQDHQHDHEKEHVHQHHQDGSDHDHEHNHHSGGHDDHGGEHGSEHGDDHGGGHEPDLAPLVFIIGALLIGSIIRHLLRNSPIPYTVLLLLIGLAAGVLVRLGLFESWNLGLFEMDVSIISKTVDWAANIDPHMLLFVFLPVLIFEAAFAMDVHTFKKSVTNAILLAVPGIIMALLMTAALAMALSYLGLGLNGWEWPIAFMFGAVVSATDPVAVVALLKELGASKKLGTLIEGESLLNDGTAIVLFMVFFLGITGASSGDSPILEFLKVSLGGALVGVVIGYITILWVKGVFNDALVEISFIIAAAYLTFFVAEHFLHVSGVLALVALGLVMAGVGRTRISPEVEHFMHEFWELAGFIANTLLFLIVGVVIAERSVFSLGDFVILAIIYIGIHLVRAIVILILYPFMKKAGYGLPKKDAYVVWYGALRGAIGLALALIVAGVDDKYIPAEIKNQFLFLTAGIVTLTLLVNATTIKFLINSLGLTKLAPAKKNMVISAQKYVHHSSEKALEKLKKDRFVGKANWDAVSAYLPPEVTENEEDLHEQSSIAEIRRRILEKEKSSYWSQFKTGLLGAAAVSRLNDAINHIIDAGGEIELSERTDLEEEWKAPELLAKLQTYPIIGRIARQLFFDRLTVSYDSAAGFVMAQEEALRLVDSMNAGKSSDEETKNLEKVEEEINENRIHGLTFLRNLRNSYPEIYSAIATRQATRSMLNSELHTVDRLLKRGRIDSGEAAKMVTNIELRMKKLVDSPPAINLPQVNDLLKGMTWLQDVPEEVFTKVVGMFQNRIFSVGQTLIKEGTNSDGLFVIVRGKVRIGVDDRVVDVLGAGDVVGEMGVLTKQKRTASVTAESPCTVMWISAQKLRRAMGMAENLESRLWDYAAARYVENLLYHKDPYSSWNQKEFRDWASSGNLRDVKEGETIRLGTHVGILLDGQVYHAENKEKKIAPAVLQEGDVVSEGNAKIFLCAKHKD